MSEGVGRWMLGDEWRFPSLGNMKSQRFAVRDWAAEYETVTLRAISADSQGIAPDHFHPFDFPRSHHLARNREIDRGNRPGSTSKQGFLANINLTTIDDRVKRRLLTKHSFSIGNDERNRRRRLIVVEPEGRGDRRRFDPRRPRPRRRNFQAGRDEIGGTSRRRRCQLDGGLSHGQNGEQSAPIARIKQSGQSHDRRGTGRDRVAALESQREPAFFGRFRGQSDDQTRTLSGRSRQGLRTRDNRFRADRIQME